MERTHSNQLERPSEHLNIIKSPLKITKVTGHIGSIGSHYREDGYTILDDHWMQMGEKVVGIRMLFDLRLPEYSRRRRPSA